jgi:hypothetical protein
MGGERRLPFGKSHFKRFIVDNYGDPFSRQRENLIRIMADYMGPEAPRDDITVLGFRPTPDSGEALC